MEIVTIHILVTILICISFTIYTYVNLSNAPPRYPHWDDVREDQVE